MTGTSWMPQLQSQLADWCLKGGEWAQPLRAGRGLLLYPSPPGRGLAPTSSVQAQEGQALRPVWDAEVWGSPAGAPGAAW